MNGRQLLIVLLVTLMVVGEVCGSPFQKLVVLGKFGDDLELLPHLVKNAFRSEEVITNNNDWMLLPPPPPRNNNNAPRRNHQPSPQSPSQRKVRFQLFMDKYAMVEVDW